MAWPAGFRPIDADLPPGFTAPAAPLAPASAAPRRRASPDDIAAFDAAVRRVTQMPEGPAKVAARAQLDAQLDAGGMFTASPPPPPPGPETDAHGNRIVRNPDGSIKFLQGPGFRGNADLSPDRNLVDVGGIGIAPEDALMAGQVGRAVLKRGLTLTGRAAELAAHVTPVVKYEIAKHTLTAVGVPESVATVAAIAVSGYQRGGAKTPAPPMAAEEGAVSVAGYPRGTGTPAAGTAPPPQLGTPVGRVTATPAPVTPPPAAPIRDVNAVPAAAASAPPAAPVRVAARPAAAAFNPSAALADVKATFTALGETPLRAEASNAMEYIRRGESAEDAVAHVLRLRPTPVRATPVPAAAGPAAPAVAAAKPVWTAEEVVLGQRLMARGLTQQEAMDAIVAQRALLQVPGAQSSAAVRAAQDLRNAQGATKTPSAATAATRRR